MFAPLVWLQRLSQSLLHATWGATRSQLEFHKAIAPLSKFPWITLNTILMIDSEFGAMLVLLKAMSK